MYKDLLLIHIGSARPWTVWLKTDKEVFCIWFKDLLCTYKKGGVCQRFTNNCILLFRVLHIRFGLNPTGLQRRCLFALSMLNIFTLCGIGIPKFWYSVEKNFFRKWFYKICKKKLTIWVFRFHIQLNSHKPVNIS